MEFLDDFLLVFVGGGDVYEQLRLEVSSKGLSDRVISFPVSVPKHYVQSRAWPMSAYHSIRTPT